MPDHTPPRFYGELARFWPLISPVDDYAEESAEFLRVLDEALPDAATLLELGSGGGHIAYYLKRRFRLTLTDLSDDMLAVSRQLNPDCEHVPGDMRALRLDRTFDLVFVQDAVSYMCSEADLAAAIDTAYEHCRPGGVALFVPDEVKETYEPETGAGGSDAPDGAGVRYLEWSYDPNPTDSQTTTEYAFVLREADGTVRVVAETHLAGLFPSDTWVRLLEARGFTVRIELERTEDERTPRRMFVARRSSR